MKNMNQPKFIGSLLLAMLGAIVAFYPFAPSIPKKSELKSVDGILLSAEFRSRRGSEIQLNSTNKSFIYRSHGRRCGNVQEKLTSELGNSLSIKYLPVTTTDWFGNVRPFSVYEIHVGTKPICTYEQVVIMIQADFEFLPLLGDLMLLVGLLMAVSSLSVGGIKHQPKSKSLEEQLKDEFELEEGEKIIGDQWKESTIPNNSKNKPSH